MTRMRASHPALARRAGRGGRRRRRRRSDDRRAPRARSAVTAPSSAAASTTMKSLPSPSYFSNARGSAARPADARPAASHARRATLRRLLALPRAMSRLRWMTAGESHGPRLTAHRRGHPRRAPAPRGGHRRRPRAAPARLRPRRPDEDRDRPRRVHRRRARRRDARLAHRDVDREPRPRQLARPHVARSRCPRRPSRSRARARATPTSPGGLKHDRHDLRDILERASARETASRTAVGAVCRKLLGAVGHRRVRARRRHRARSTADRRRPVARRASRARSRASDLACADAGGRGADEGRHPRDARTRATRSAASSRSSRPACLPGLGSHVQWDRKLDGRLAQALMSIQAIKGVEIGAGFGGGADARLRGARPDPLRRRRAVASRARRNRAGGLEGGITNGEPVVCRVAMKPIATLKKALASVDVRTKEAYEAAFERSDVCAVAGGERRRRGDGVHRPRRRAAREVRRRLAARALAQRRRLPRPARRVLSRCVRSSSAASWRRARARSGPRSPRGSACRSSTPTRRSSAPRGEPVPELWREEGEAAFRAREAALVAELLRRRRAARHRVRRRHGHDAKRRAASRSTARSSSRSRRRRRRSSRASADLARAAEPRARGRSRGARAELLEARAEAYAECHLALVDRRARRRTRSSTPSSRSRRATRCVVPLGDAQLRHRRRATTTPARLTDAIARCAPSSLVLVTDSNVQRARGAAIDAALRRSPSRARASPCRRASEHKTLASVATIWDAALGARRRSRRARRRGGRRRRRRSRRLRRGVAPARRPLRPGADDAARDGRLVGRRQDGVRPSRRQEPHRRLPPAERRRRRPRAPRRRSRRASARCRPRRGREDRPRDRRRAPRARSSATRPRSPRATTRRSSPSCARAIDGEDPRRARRRARVRPPRAPEPRAHGRSRARGARRLHPLAPRRGGRARHRRRDARDGGASAGRRARSSERARRAALRRSACRRRVERAELAASWPFVASDKKRARDCDSPAGRHGRGRVARRTRSVRGAPRRAARLNAVPSRSRCHGNRAGAPSVSVSRSRRLPESRGNPHSDCIRGWAGCCCGTGCSRRVGPRQRSTGRSRWSSSTSCWRLGNSTRCTAS